MTDNQSGVQEQVVAPTQVDPATTSQPEVVDQQPNVTQTTETETVENEASVPKTNAAWAAQRVANKRLEEENARLHEVVSSIDPEYLNRLREMNTPQVPQFAAQPLAEDADYTQVTQGLNLTNQAIQRQNQELANLKYQIELAQDKQAEEAFPELKSDKDFQQIVAEKKLASRMAGLNKTTIEIARETKRLLERRDQRVSVQSAEQTKQQIIEKQVATAEPTGNTSGGNSAVDNEAFRSRVRRGDTQALEELGKNIIAGLEF